VKALIRQNLKLIIESSAFAEFIHSTATEPDLKKSAHNLAVECKQSLAQIERFREDNK